MSYDRCKICPRMCGVNRNEGNVGFCGVGNKIRIARADLHYWEEPCISGKNGSGAIFFSGCNLRCVFCQNYEISNECNGFEISEDELSKTFLALEAKGAENINLVTATHYIPSIVNTIKKSKENGLSIPIIYNSGGYERVESLKLLDGLIDVYLPDFKYYNNKYALKYSGASNYKEIAQIAIEEMYRQVGKVEFDEKGMIKKGVIVRHLMLPGLLFDSKKIIDYLHKRYKNDIWISIMNQYTPLNCVKSYPELDRVIEKKYYDSLVNYAIELGVENAFIQGEGSRGENFIPEFYKN